MKRSILFILILAVWCRDANAQADSMRYVDFHMHSSMKNYYRDVPRPALVYSDSFKRTMAPLQNWEGDRHRQYFAPGRKFSGFSGKSSRPEASWNLIAGMKPGIRMLCTSITPIEKRFVSEKRIPIGILGIRPKIRTINKAVVTRLSRERQHAIHQGTSFDELLAEIEYMKIQPANPVSGGRNVRLVKDAVDLRTANSNNETGLILTVEGAHSLMGNLTIGQEFEPQFGLDANGFRELSANLLKLKTMPYHVFFMTFSHMSWNAMCGQAKSLDMKSPIIRYLLGFNSDDKRFRKIAAERLSGRIDTTAAVFKRADDAFAIDPCNCGDPIIKTYKTYGQEVLQMLLDTTGGQRRILIDMRHLAIGGRQQYIDTVMSRRSRGDTIPLIVSHAAVSGKSFDQAELYGKCSFADRYLEVQNPRKFYGLYKPCNRVVDKNGVFRKQVPKIDLNKSGWFHPFSINLYDEEIECVYESDGIIGITLEERVLGTGRWNYTRAHYDTLARAFKSWPQMTDPKDRKTAYHDLKVMEPFMRNLLYILEHSGSAGNIKSWSHVAIGSDWDGMIDPLDVCASPEDLPHFYRLLEHFLPLYANLYHETRLFPAGYSTQQLLNRLFFENGEKFITQHFK